MYNSTGLSGTKSLNNASNAGVLTLTDYKRMKDKILAGTASEEQERLQREVNETYFRANSQLLTYLTLRNKISLKNHRPVLRIGQIQSML